MVRDATRAANPEAEDASLAAVGKLLREAMYTRKVDSCGVKVGLGESEWGSKSGIICMPWVWWSFVLQQWHISASFL